MSTLCSGELKKRQNRPSTPKMINGLIQHITVVESTSIKWVNLWAVPAVTCICRTFDFLSKFYSIIQLCKGSWATDDFATTFDLVLFSVALILLAKSIHVHSIVLFSHLCFCLPLLLFPLTVPCRIILLCNKVLFCSYRCG